MKRSGNKILTIGLNPAWQKTLHFKLFLPSEINRASSVSYLPAGKGVNFARAAKTWGMNATVCQFVGGFTGKNIIQSLRKERIDNISVISQSSTRICTTCLCDKTGSMTELIEPSSRILKTESDLLMKKIKAQIPRVKAVAICGTYPEGISSDFYVEIAKFAKKNRVPLMLDSFKGVVPVLKEGVHILKINRQELGQITRAGNLPESGFKCMRNFKVEILAVTDGPGDAWLFIKDKYFKYKIPRFSRIVNPLGAGDTVAAVFLSELINGKAPELSFMSGLAAGTASCLTAEPAFFKLSIANKLRSKIKLLSF